ncbi:MAG TPA: helix-turn-helix domain-containing protein [Xanthobacteraceae bacterium]|nr:helix-turn-helix domain-containing protein [Xanthobacteraceae bacterium]
MTASLERPEAAMPTQEESELATRASQVLAPKAQEELKIKLDDGTELTLPKAATRLLHHILTQMSLGNAVTLFPIHAELTTQEAADYLNVSRPFLIKLLETNRIPFHMVGTHRRVKFTELEAFRRKSEQERRAAMQELVDQAQELRMGY